MEVHLAMVHREKTGLASSLCKLQFVLTIQRISHNGRNRNYLAPGTKWQVNNVLECRRPKQNIFFYHISVICCYGGHCPHCCSPCVHPSMTSPATPFISVCFSTTRFFFSFCNRQQTDKVSSRLANKVIVSQPRRRHQDAGVWVCGWMCVCV